MRHLIALSEYAERKARDELIQAKRAKHGKARREQLNRMHGLS